MELYNSFLVPTWSRCYHIS